MKAKEYTKKDGTKGIEYTLESGDVVVSMFPKCRTQEGAMISKVTGKAVPTKRHSLGVKWNDKDIFIKITAGQKKVLDKVTDLTGKKISAREYSNDYGKQVGVTVN